MKSIKWYALRALRGFTPRTKPLTSRTTLVCELRGGRGEISDGEGEIPQNSAIEPGFFADFPKIAPNENHPLSPYEAVLPLKSSTLPRN
eukprot:2385737-Pyramimonas_sp.AAC.1